MRRGRVELILGPMFAGKSTELVRRLARHERANRRLLVAKYKHDTRYSLDPTISTHDKADILSARPCKTLSELSTIEANKYRPADVIGIDEGQFFPDLVEFCDEAANSGKERAFELKTTALMRLCCCCQAKPSLCLPWTPRFRESHSAQCAI